MIGSRLLVLLFGTLLLLSCASGEDEQLSPEEKRKIIKSMLKSQKDIRRALLKIRQQIINDGHVSDDGDDVEEDSSGESEEHGEEKQIKIIEARERINAHVRGIAESFEEMHQLIAHMDHKVVEVLANSDKPQVSYNLYYKPGLHPKPKPSSEESEEMSNEEVTTTETPTVVWLPTRPPMPAYELKEQERRKRPHRKSYRGSRVLEVLGASEEVVQ